MNWRVAGRGLVGTAAVAFAVLAYTWLTLPDVRPLRTGNPNDTAFMRLRAVEAARAGRTSRSVQRWVSYERISPSLTRAVRLTEDAAFWQHEGLDYDEIRAAVEKDWSRFAFVRGGSTITQQLAKNLFLSPSRNPFRKIEEVFITRRLEAELSKERIFELYLNVIEWGDGIWGAEAAAETYFHVPASQLNAEQAALLAAAIINPRLYNPAHPNARLLRRQQIILRRMGVPAQGRPSSEDAADADQLAAPVRRIEMLDTDRAAGAGRVDELAEAGRAQCDAHVSRAFRRGGEEEEVALPDVARRDLRAGVILLGDGPRHVDLMSLEDVADESAAVKA
jgi:monofunctional biosynthetic peptidoglycan transglycosylase